MWFLEEVKERLCGTWRGRGVTKVVMGGKGASVRQLDGGEGVDVGVGGKGGGDGVAVALS